MEAHKPLSFCEKVFAQLHNLKAVMLFAKHQGKIHQIGTVHLGDLNNWHHLWTCMRQPAICRQGMMLATVVKSLMLTSLVLTHAYTHAYITHAYIIGCSSHHLTEQNRVPCVRVLACCCRVLDVLSYSVNTLGFSKCGSAISM